MLVKLPRQCSGKELVEAFGVASTFQEKPEKRWESHEFVGNFQYEPGSVKQTIRSMGVRVWPSSLRKKWGLFGKKVWKPDFNPKFTLTPVVLSNLYGEVEVAVEYAYGADQIGNDYIATDPHAPEFELIRSQFERILSGFYARLQL